MNSFTPRTFAVGLVRCYVIVSLLGVWTLTSVVFACTTGCYEYTGHATATEEVGVAGQCWKYDVPHAQRQFIAGGADQRKERVSDSPLTVVRWEAFGACELKCGLNVAEGGRAEATVDDVLANPTNPFGKYRCVEGGE